MNVKVFDAVKVLPLTIVKVADDAGAVIVTLLIVPAVIPPTSISPTVPENTSEALFACGMNVNLPVDWSKPKKPFLDLTVVPKVVVYVPAVTEDETTKVNVVPFGTDAIVQVPFSFACSVPVAPEIVIISPAAYPAVETTVPVTVVLLAPIKLVIVTVAPAHLNSTPLSLIASATEVSPPKVIIGSSKVVTVELIVVVVPFTIKLPPTTALVPT